MRFRVRVRDRVRVRATVRVRVKVRQSWAHGARSALHSPCGGLSAHAHRCPVVRARVRVRVRVRVGVRVRAAPPTHTGALSKARLRRVSS